MTHEVFTIYTKEDIKEIVREAVTPLLHSKNETPKYFDLNGIVENDPHKRAKQTFYGYLSNPNHPFNDIVIRKGKRIVVKSEDFFNWIDSGQTQSTSSAVDQILENKK